MCLEHVNSSSDNMQLHNAAHMHMIRTDGEPQGLESSETDGQKHGLDPVFGANKEETLNYL